MQTVDLTTVKRRWNEGPVALVAPPNRAPPIGAAETVWTGTATVIPSAVSTSEKGGTWSTVVTSAGGRKILISRRNASDACPLLRYGVSRIDTTVHVPCLLFGSKVR